jgi:hypothetical protein
MPDQRSVMKEYRFLDQKRLAQGLTPDEEARLARLRELVGPESGAGGLKPGFDVNAAAAALRESLLPAGLRNRPPPTPAAAPAPQEPEPTPAEPGVADTLASVYDQAPFAPLDEAAAAPVDPLFDPSSLGTEPPPYDPSAQGFDAGQGYDPSQQPYDPNYPPYDPGAYPADGTYDASGQPAWDPNQPWDPNAQPADPAAQAYDPNAAPYDPNAPASDAAAQTYDPNTPASDAAAQAYDPNAAPYDPSAYPTDGTYDASGQPAWDAGQPYDPGAAPAEPAWDPNQPWDAGAAPEVPAEAAAEAGQESDDDVETIEDAELVEEAEPVPGEAALPEGGSFTPGDAGAVPGWDAEPPPPEPTTGAEFGEYDAPPAAPALADTLFGDMPPAEPEPEVSTPAAAAPALGEYDDTAGFGAEPFDTAAVPPDAPGLDADARAPELDPAWQPEAALAGGFELASGGSFGAGADAAAPEWAQQSPPPPWQDAPPLDLGGVPEPAAAEDATGYEIAPAPASETFNTLPGTDLFGAPEGDLLPPEGEVAVGAEDAAGPELDYSQPDLSAPEDATPEPPPADPGVFANLSDLPPEEAGEPLSGGELDAGLPPEAAPWDAASAAELEPPAPEAEYAAVEGELAAPEAELAPSEAELAPPEPELAPPESELAEPTPFEEPPAEPALDGAVAEADALAEAALPAETEVDDAEVVDAAELTEVAEVEEPPPDLASVPEAPAEPGPELSFDLAEQPPVAAPEEPDPALAALDAAALAPEPPAQEPAPSLDLSFDAEEEPAAAVVAPPPPAVVFAPPPPAPAEEEIPTIDGADILEEIVEEVPSAPPQSLDFEPLAPAAPPPAAAAPPAPVAIAPPPPAPAPAAVIAPPPPVAAPAVDAEPAPAAGPDYRVPGAHRVVVHTVEGLVKRGVLEDPDLGAPALSLAPQPGAQPDEVPTEKVKAIFFMLSPGEKAPAAEGKKVRVTFRDGRQIAGFSPDWRDDGIGFFMIPADTKTNTGRIWVYRSAVRQVSVN